ncbi:MAG: response regulator [Novosphingobium sp.]|nr:response regulator [Novosphingobium sp.]
MLIVEDEPLILFYAADLAEQAGFAVEEAGNAEEAISILESHRDIRVVVSDIRMPGAFDGLGLAELIRQRWPEIEVILTSGHARAEDADLTGATFLPKPYTPQEFVTTLRDHSGPGEPSRNQSAEVVYAQFADRQGSAMGR